MTLAVLYEDNHLLIVDKPAGLLVQGGDGADDHLFMRAGAWLKATYHKPGNAYVGLVHRLDRNTSGVVVLAKTSKAAARLSQAFAGRAVEKTYLAVVAGLTPPAGTLEHWLAATSDGGSRVVAAGDPDARQARLTFTTLAISSQAAPASALAVRLETGRKHQIRVQLAAAAHPLLGDRRYAPPETAARFVRPALHAWTITFAHPVGGRVVTCRAPLPSDLTRLLGDLRLPVTAPAKNGA